MLNQVVEMDIIFLEQVTADNLFIKLKINVLLNPHLHPHHLQKKLLRQNRSLLQADYTQYLHPTQRLQYTLAQV